jgi:hypothetical protein
VTNVSDRVQAFLLLSMLAIGMVLTGVAIFQTLTGRF